MADFIVNEANFVIDMDDGIKDDWLRPGQHLPSGHCIESLADRAANFQLYEVTDGSVQVLAVQPELKARWVKDGFVPEDAFMPLNSAAGPLFVMLSPATLVLGRITELRAYGSLRYALNVAAALQSARRKNGQVSLRDGIYCELYATVLPTFTQTRAVCDRALFLNVLSPDRSEIIAASDELSPSALNVSIVRSDLQAHGFNLPKFAPFFVSGEVVQPQGFAQSLTIAGAVALHEAYQLYACEGDAYLLLLEPNFAAAMCNAGLLWPHELLNLRVDRAVWRAQVLSKRYAVESLNDRHFGLTLEGAAALALAMQRTRDSLPQADLSSGLYLAQRGIILCPSGGGSDADDGKLYAHILHHGPFAQAPLNDLAIKVLTRLVA